MFYFALKNLLTRKSKTILSAISIIMATTIGLLAFNISSQVNDGIINTVEYYDTLIGPSGSESQLVLNTMFFTGTPAGTISYEYYENLENDVRVNVAVPFAMGQAKLSSQRIYQRVFSFSNILNRIFRLKLPILLLFSRQLSHYQCRAFLNPSFIYS